MRVRIRLAELLAEKQTNPHKLERDHRISARTLYRIKRANGQMRFLDSHLLDALCDALGVTPGELLER